MVKKIDRSCMFFYLRLLFGVVLLLLLVKMVGFDEMSHAFISLKPHLIAAGLLGIAIDSVLMTYRWGIILWVRRPDVSFSQLLRFYLISGFLGNFAPFSSDLIKIYCSFKHTSDSNGAVSSVFIDRVIGTFSLGIITMMAFLALRKTDMALLGTRVSFAIIALGILSIGGPLALQTGVILRPTRELLGQFRWRLMGKLAEICQSVLLYQNQRRVIAKVLGISFANHVISIWVYYIIAQSFSTSISIGYFLLFIPVAHFLAMVPVTVGGIGVFEGAIVYLFSSVGMPVEMCLSMVLCQRLLRLAVTLPGGVMYSLGGIAPKRLPT